MEARADRHGSGNSMARAGDWTCLKCHKFEANLTHPTGVAPSMSTPAALPLVGGEVNCSTCHDVPADHEGSGGKVGLRSGFDAASICGACHGSVSPGSKAVHALSLGKAHLKSGNKQGLPASAGDIDFESKTCMGCHDGAAASAAGAHAVRGPESDEATEHPIGVPMRLAPGGSRRDFGLANAAALDSRIRLANGKLSCGSCHSVYSREAGELVMSNQGSKLCLNCHKQ